jgi:hypothetical protein
MNPPRFSLFDASFFTLNSKAISVCILCELRRPNQCFPAASSSYPAIPPSESQNCHSSSFINSTIQKGDTFFLFSPFRVWANYSSFAQAKEQGSVKMEAQHIADDLPLAAPIKEEEKEKVRFRVNIHFRRVFILKYCLDRL